jgi:hypothetical protein
MRDLWIDFNDVESGDEVETLLKFAEPGSLVAVGRTLVVGDDDGTICEAEVLDVRDGLVRLRLDRRTLTHHAAVPVTRAAV